MDRSLFDFWRSPKTLKQAILAGGGTGLSSLTVSSAHGSPSHLSSPTKGGLPAVADIEDLLVDSSFFSDLEMLDDHELGKVGDLSLAPGPNPDSDPPAQQQKPCYLQLRIITMDGTTRYEGFSQIALLCSRPDGAGATATAVVTVYLRDLWMSNATDLALSGGALINILPYTDSSSIVIGEGGPHVLIYEPGRLLTITAVADAVSCMRKAALSLRSPTGPTENPPTVHLVTGSIVHEVFEEAILRITRDGHLKSDGRPRGDGNCPDDHDHSNLECMIEEALQRHTVAIYACGVGEDKVRAVVTEVLGGFSAWRERFLRNTPRDDARVIDEVKGGGSGHGGINRGQSVASTICIPQVFSLEEAVTSRAYGLKGKVDAVVLMQFHAHTDDQPRRVSLVVPLELKTGHSTNSTAHRAQTLLYTLLLSDRYGLSIDYGLLYYMASGSLLRIRSTPHELQALLMIRNRLAAAVIIPPLAHQLSSTFASSIQSLRVLPPPLRHGHQCRQCGQLPNCATMLALERAGDGEASVCHREDSHGTNEVIEERIQLQSETLATRSHFYHRWNTLLELEETECRRLNDERIQITRAILYRCLPEDSLRGASRRYTAEFLLTTNEDNDKSGGSGSELSPGDPVSILNATGDDVAIGSIMTMAMGRIVISCDRDIGQSLRAVRTDHQSDQSTGIIPLEVHTSLGESFGLCKDELVTAFALGRSNLLQLYRNQHLLELLVDWRPPHFRPEEAEPLNSLTQPSDLDDGQRRAIAHCLRAEDYALLLGMPGTGKTTTLVALIKQLVDRGERLIVSAYTHSAVDNVLSRLLTVGVPVLRLGSADRVDRSLAKHTLPLGSVENLAKAISSSSVLGLTCLAASNHVLLAAVPPFDWCIIDEASQVTVPAVLGPLLRARRFLLVGDHYQLPPLVKSAVAREKSLDISLFRLLAEAHPAAVVTLRRQYRMAEDIQTIANRTVYGGQLECASEAVAQARLILPHQVESSLFCAVCGDDPDCWIRWVLNPNHRVLFLDTDGIVPAAREEAVGTSFHNRMEALCVRNLIAALIGGGLGGDQVCVIAPFRGQCRLLGQFLSAYPPEMEISTVDRYQGRDKDCVILSFVRSNEAHQMGGLLSDWHRLNVALTRAKRKLVMIGSWTTIMEDTRAGALMGPLRELILERDWKRNLPSNGPAHEPL